MFSKVLLQAALTFLYVLNVSCEARLSSGLTSKQNEEDQIRFCDFLFMNSTDETEQNRVLRECHLPLYLERLLEKKQEEE